MTKPIKFRTYTRFDVSKAKHGVKHTIIDENGNNYGTFTTSLYDSQNKTVQVEMERWRRENLSALKAQGVAMEAIGLHCFVAVCVLDLEGVFDEDGKAVPFSKEVALAYLSLPEMEWAADQLIRLSADVTLYKSDPVATQDEVVKN